MNIHHKYYVNSIAPWDYPNEALETLCSSCHNELHKENKIGKFETKEALLYYIHAFQSKEKISDAEMHDKWEEYKKQWHEFSSMERPWVEITHPIQCGIYLPVSEFRYFQEHNFPLSEIQAYTWSGKNAYEVMKNWRLKENCKYDLNDDSAWEMRPLLQGERYNYYYPGFYKVIYVFGDTIGTLYSAIETDDYLPEEIMLTKHSLENSTSYKVHLGDTLLIRRCALAGNHYEVNWMNWTIQKEINALQKELQKYRLWYEKSIESNTQWEIEHCAGADIGMNTEKPYPSEAINWLVEEEQQINRKIKSLFKQLYI